MGTFLKLGGSCDIRETGCRVRHAKVTSVHLPSEVLQAYRGKVKSFFTFSRDAARKKNALATWEASLKCGESCGVRERVVARLAWVNYVPWHF